MGDYAMGRMFDGLLFDKDGTLFDFRASWGLWAADFLATLASGPDHAAALAEAIGYLPAEHSFAPDSVVIAATSDDIAERLLPHLPGRSLIALQNEINQAAAEVRMTEAVPLLPLLQGFRDRGLRLGVATNDAEGSARAHLAGHGLTDAVDYIAGYDSGHGPKPGPGMCLAFAQAQGLDPARVLMVGDSRHDLSAGRAAGMKTMAVLTGIATAEDLMPYADALLPDIGHLPGWLDNPVWI